MGGYEAPFPLGAKEILFVKVMWDSEAYIPIDTPGSRLPVVSA